MRQSIGMHFEDDQKENVVMVLLILYEEWIGVYISQTFSMDRSMPVLQVEFLGLDLREFEAHYLC